MLKKLEQVAFILAIVSLFYAFGSTSNNDLDRSLPPFQEYSGESSSLNGKYVSQFYLGVVSDETLDIKVQMRSDYFVYTGELDQNLRVKESIAEFKKSEIIEALGHDKRITLYDPGKNIMLIKYYLGDVAKGVKTISYNGRPMDSDVMSVCLQDKLLNKATDFTADIILKARGMRFPVNFHLVNGGVKQLPSATPDKIKTVIAKHREVHMYVMEIAGLAHIFYPYKFYYVYENDYPYRFIAYWGGAPKDLEYQVIY